MMGRMMAFIVVVVCSAQVVLLRAQEPSLDFADKRFTYHHIDDGYLRLDLRTGEVATCRQREAGWACTLAPEERAALESEITRLQRDNALLKNALLERGLPLPAPGTDAPATAAPPQGVTPAQPPGAQPPGELPAPPPVASAPPQTDPPTASVPPRPPAAIPTEPDLAQRDKAEVDRVMDMMERLWRRLVELVAAIQRDIYKKG
jgi:hypothetical protein